MGRSRGGLTTKIHALVDANGLPITLKLTEGQAHDGRSTKDMLGAVKAGAILLADRAYDSDSLRQALESRGAWGNIRLMPNRKKRPAFSAWLYRQRNAVEASSTNSNTSEPLQYDTTSTTTTSSPPSSSHPSAYG